MGDPHPQPTRVLIHRLRRVARWLDQKAPQATTSQGQAQVRARANTCWQSAARLEEILSRLREPDET